MTVNSRMGKNKRKTEVQILNYTALKNRKLDIVGDRSRFDTDKVNWYEDHETGGFTSGYTDLITKQPMYKTVLSFNIAPW